VALETSYTPSESSTSDRDPRYQRRLSSNPNQRGAFTTAGDYAGGVAQFPKKPEADYHALFKECNDRAKAFFQHNEYESAEDNLIQAIYWARERQKYYGIAFDEIGMQDLLGDIYLQAQNYAQALGVWIELLPRVNNRDQVITLQHCHHFHLVAEVFYCMWRDKQQHGQDAPDDLKSALENAESTYNKRDEILGNEESRTSPEVRLSADLFARIHDALGNSAETSVYHARADGIKNNGLDWFERLATSDGVLQDGQTATEELHKAIEKNNAARVLDLLKNTNLEFDLELYLTHQEKTSLRRS